MTKEKMAKMLVERSEKEYGSFVHRVEHYYNSVVEKFGHYDDNIFSIVLCETLRVQGVGPTVATTLLYFARKHIEGMQKKEDNNG